MDLADAHLKSLSYFEKGFNVYNVGTGIGYTVKEVIQMIEKISNKSKLFYWKKKEWRYSTCYANVDKIKNKMGWTAQYNLEQMCKDSYNFIINYE